MSSGVASCDCSGCVSNPSLHIASLSSHCIPAIMPSAQDWKVTPWNTIQKIFSEKQALGGTVWEHEVMTYFSNQLGPADSWSAEFPSLNLVPTHELVDGQIVRFRCMIQDIFDPEYYLSTFEIKDLSTGKVRLQTGKYRDLTPCGPREELNPDSDVTVNRERQSFYAISIPGEAPWVETGFKQSSPTFPVPSSSCQKNRLKRQHQDDEAMEDGAAAPPASEQLEKKAASSKDVEMLDDEVSGDNKKAKTENGHATNTGAGSNSMSFNFPLPGSKGKAAIIKCYDMDNSFSLNDTYEFIGIVSLDPSLAILPPDASEHDVLTQFGAQEHMAKSPPPSLVPRIHVLKQHKLTHSNPLLPLELPKTIADVQDARKCRSELHSVLTKALMGDGLAADYLICHLVSKIYARREVLTLGKFTLNLFGVPLLEDYTKKLATILQLLMTKSHYLPMTVDNFNKNCFVPKKDYHSNRLVTGLLQLSKGTHLILDETKMSNGELNPDGVRNLTSLGMLINWQKVEYNFSYHQLEFEKDVPCLVLSEGRSMLPNDSQLLLKPTDPVTGEGISEQFRSIGLSLNVQLLESLRKFLTVVRNLSFDVSDDVQNFVQEDFVNERQNGTAAERMTAEDLHSHLVLARLVALGHGLSTLDPESWSKVKSMEKERKERMAHLPSRARPNGPLAGNVV